MNRAIRERRGLLVIPILFIAVLMLILPISAGAAEYECTASLPVSVKLNGDFDETFIVTIAPGDGTGDGLPMPENREISIAGDSSSAFEGLRYTAPGDYVYTVTQKAGNTEFMTYDETVYTVVVQVTNAADGGLTYQVYASRDDDTESKSAEISFINTYSPPPEENPSAPQTGDTNSVGEYAAISAVAAAALFLMVFIFKRSLQDDRQ